VERGLPVEYDIVSVPQLPLHDVARIQLSISSVLSVGQVNLLAIVTDDELCPRPCGGAIAHKLLHHSHVLASDVLGDGQIHGDCLWNSQLVQLKNRVWGDDSTS